MKPTTLTPAEAFPVGEYVADELKARGWTTAYAASLMDGDAAINKLWLDLLCCLPVWEKHGIEFSESEAKKLGRLFGTSTQLWLNLHGSFLRAKQETEPSEAAKTAGKIVEALMCKLSDRGIAKMDLVEDVLNHCLFVFSVIIERHTTELQEETERLKQLLDTAQEYLIELRVEWALRKDEWSDKTAERYDRLELFIKRFAKETTDD